MNGNEQRRYERYKTEALAAIHTQDESIPATITDMGKGGFGMVIQKAIPQGTQVMVELKFLGEYAIQGIVKWSSQLMDGQHIAYRIGVEVESIIWTDLKTIAFPKWDELVGKIISEAEKQ
jgi:hypothetical protein